MKKTTLQIVVMYKDQQDNKGIQKTPVAGAMHFANLHHLAWRPEDSLTFITAGIVSLQTVGKTRHSLSGINLILL